MKHSELCRILSFLLLLSMASGCIVINNAPQVTPAPTPIPTPSEAPVTEQTQIPTTSVTSPLKQVTPEQSQYEKNVEIVTEISQDYHSKHTYLGTLTGQSSSIYVCVDMAKDVWNMIETRGIHAIINVGNVDKDISSISEANHAWVMAEVGPDNWLAVETTGGYVVHKSENPRYYTAIKFDTPADLNKFSCGMAYCFSGTCNNGECSRCNSGYVMGDDNLCHLQCGSGTYCTGNSICINGECKGCNPGYYIGTDYQCHPGSVSTIPTPETTNTRGYVTAATKSNQIHPGEVLRVGGTDEGPSTSVTVAIYQLTGSSRIYVTSKEVAIEADRWYEADFPTDGFSPGQYGIIVTDQTGEYTKLSFMITG